MNAVFKTSNEAEDVLGRLDAHPGVLLGLKTVDEAARQGLVLHQSRK